MESMPEQRETMERVARDVRVALEQADLSAFKELLDPNVTWGAPDARRPTCRSRDQVLSWYQRAREAGGRARVSSVAVHGDHLLVSLAVSGARRATAQGGSALRWQVLTVRSGRIVDIVGFDDRMDAAARVGAPTD
jgi:ketosteroid isomerase-like protein